MITEKSMDMELNDSGLDWLVVRKLGMYPMKGDLMDTGTFADSLSDSTSFLQERMNDLDVFLYDKTPCNKETLHYDFAASVSGGNIYSPDYAFFDSSLLLGQDVDTFPSFDSQRCEVLMSSPLSCNDLESVLNTDMTTNNIHAESSSLMKYTGVTIQSVEEGLPVATESDSSDAFSPSPSTSGIDSYNVETSSPASSTCFSSQPGSPFPSQPGSPFQLGLLAQSEIHPETPQPEKFQSKAKRSKSCRTKNNNNRSPYDSSSISTESASSPSPSLYDSTAGVEQLSKKDKKKLQNKNAAIRYRQKMKAEAKTRMSEEEELLAENARLKEKVDDLQREIRYVANLMEEVKKANLKSSRNT